MKMKMKWIILFVLFFPTVFVYSQNLFLKKETVLQDTIVEFTKQYHYNDEMQLQAIYTLESDQDTALAKHFENNRLVMEIYPGYIIKFTHFQDTVFEYRKLPGEDFKLTFMYLLNGSFQATESFLIDQFGQYSLSETYHWNNGNCTKTTVFGSEFESFTYDANVQNPYFNENKFFRRRYPGSQNQLIHADFYPIEFNYTVISTAYGYPIEVTFNPSLGEERSLLYEYHEPSGVEDWPESVNLEILEIKYYNLMGQEITKPLHGFYIERLLTNKGVISKKLFIE